MIQKTPNTALAPPLTPDLLKVLRATAKASFLTLSSLTKITGQSAREALKALQQQGFVVKQTSLNRDGSAATLYSITALGERALLEMDMAAAPSYAVAMPRTASPCTSVYQGAELRPYVARAGSMDAFRHPSRVGQFLHHPDGSVTPLE